MNRKSRNLTSLLFAAAACNGATMMAHAQDATATPTVAPTPAPMTLSDSDQWRFGVTVPVWLPGINGTPKSTVISVT